jgi:hypothetical protein
MAAHLDHVEAKGMVANSLDSPLRWRMLGECVRKKLQHNHFSESAEVFVRDMNVAFSGGWGHADMATMFEIGRAVRDHVDTSWSHVFRVHADRQTLNNAMMCLNYYKHQLAETRKAVEAWTLVAMRLGIYKDVRKLISKCVWEMRDHQFYPFEKEVEVQAPIVQFDANNVEFFGQTTFDRAFEDMFKGLTDEKWEF